MKTLGQWMDECGGRIYDETGYAPPIVQVILDAMSDAELADHSRAMVTVQDRLVAEHGDQVWDVEIE